MTVDTKDGRNSVRSGDEHTGSSPTHDTTEKILQKSKADDLITREAELQKSRSLHIGAIRGQDTPNKVGK